MITLTDYWMGRDKECADQLTAEIRKNAEQTVVRANLLLGYFKTDVGGFDSHHVNSGWRPPQVNAATPNAAAKSKHMTGEAIDIADPEGALDDWCMDHLDHLERLGLWLEHPSATKNWCHVQIVPPKSGKRVFYP
jgi:hypothetical protein